MSRLKITSTLYDKPIYCELLNEKVPKLAAKIEAILPLKTIPWHAVISGDNVGFFLPVVETEFENPVERIPGGAHLYANGQIAVICYGATSEPGFVNRFLEVEESSMNDLKELGLLVRNKLWAGENCGFITVEHA